MSFKNIASSVLSVLWVFPFVSFVFGYIITLCFFHAKEIPAPNFVGKSVQHAVRQASNAGINLRLLREKIDPDIAEGTVLEQMPRQTHSVKPNQYMFLTLSKHPQGVVTPKVLGNRQKFITSQCRELGIRTKVFWLTSHYPRDFCIAQFPQAGQQLKKRSLITYCSSGRAKFVIFPNLKGKSVSQIKEFLESEEVKIELLHTDWVNSEHDCTTCTVVDQKPMAGSIIDTSKRLYVQLQVSF